MALHWWQSQYKLSVWWKNNKTQTKTTTKTDCVYIPSDMKTLCFTLLEKRNKSNNMKHSWHASRGLSGILLYQKMWCSLITSQCHAEQYELPLWSGDEESEIIWTLWLNLVLYSVWGKCKLCYRRCYLPGRESGSACPPISNEGNVCDARDKHVQKPECVQR